MDVPSLLRTTGALGLVLGLLFLALWAVRRYNLALPGGAGDWSTRRVAVVERVSLDSRRNLLLIRRDGREHLLLVAPEGTALIEQGIVRDERDEVAADERARHAADQRQAAQQTLEQARRQATKLVHSGLSLGLRAFRRWRGRRFHKMVLTAGTHGRTGKRARRRQGRR